MTSFWVPLPLPNNSWALASPNSARFTPATCSTENQHPAPHCPRVEHILSSRVCAGPDAAGLGSQVDVRDVCRRAGGLAARVRGALGGPELLRGLGCLLQALG